MDERGDLSGTESRYLGRIAKTQDVFLYSRKRFSTSLRFLSQRTFEFCRKTSLRSYRLLPLIRKD